MPIKGVSEIVRLPRLGKIRLGIKWENDSGVTYPVPTDYFVCPHEVKQVFGDMPKELRIMFPTEDKRQWASQYLRCYSSLRGLICRGDGETAMARVDIRTREIASRDAVETELREITCNPDRCTYYLKTRCRRVLNLQFLIPECPGFGVYQLDTTSFFSIVNVNSSLDLVRSISGRVAMIPLLLKLVEQEVQPEGKKKMVKVLRLTTAYSPVEIQKYAQTPPGRVLLLPPPDSAAPPDLFPDEIPGKAEALRTILDVDEELILLWDRVKSKVWQMDIRDLQIANWFQRNYKLDIRLDDFNLLAPPPTITREHLDHFLIAIERYCNQI